MNHRTTSWNAPYTFSGKEKDVKTGYGYFGARYYDSALSIWLSVDPMSDKYPSLTPYAYCGNNPVMMVDPDGERIFVSGFFADLFISAIKNKTNLTIDYNKETGELKFSGTSQSNFADLLLNACSTENNDISVNIVGDFSENGDDKFDNSGKFLGGSKVGNIYKFTQEIDMLRGILFRKTFGGAKGYFEFHELTECIIAALYPKNHNILQVKSAYEDTNNPIYNLAHTSAFPGDFIYFFDNHENNLAAEGIQKEYTKIRNAIKACDISNYTGLQILKYTIK